MNAETNKRPLTGIRVIELGTLIAGPFAAKTLADFGAEVIKIEQPGDGDSLRRFGTMTETGDTLVWLSEARWSRRNSPGRRHTRKQRPYPTHSIAGLPS